MNRAVEDAPFILKCAWLAHVYGDEWNALTQEERAAYVRCVRAIEDRAAQSTAAPLAALEAK